MLGPVLSSTDCSKGFRGARVKPVRRARVGRCAAGALLSAAAWLCPQQARAFEGQWHLGAGLGVMAPTSSYELGGALALHGAYGISDVFDARLTLASSLFKPKESDDAAATRSSDTLNLSLATLGLAYKLDVIEWVPYFGVRAGGYYFGSEPLAPYSRRGGAIGGMAGFDYSFSRSFAVGTELSYDLLLPEGGVYGALVRAEYRWGF
jgi:hypothetical protein